MGENKLDFAFLLLSQCNCNLKRFHYLSIMSMYSLQETSTQTNLLF